MTKQILISCCVLALTVASVAPAAPVVFDIGTIYTSSGPPAGAPPYLRATFTDTALNVVSLKLETIGLATTEFVSKWFFNVDKAFSNPSLLTIAHQSGAVATVIKATSNPNTSNSFNNGGGDGFFDIGFLFPTANSPARFTGGEQSIYTISRTGLTASSFNVKSNARRLTDPDIYFTSAHIQGLPNGKSAKITGTPTVSAVPEPSTYGILLSAGVGLIAFVRRRRAVAGAPEAI